MWFFRQTGLRQQELGTGSKLECAIEEARNLSLFQRSYYLQLLNADPRWMSAVSSGARVRWKRIERRNREILLPIADGLAAAHQKRISKGKLASKIGYVLKAPKKGLSPL
jgi:hypothetical protein